MSLPHHRAKAERPTIHILVLTEQWFPDYTGGSGRVATDTAIALGARGHRVTVVAPVCNGEPAVSQAAQNVTLHRVVGRPDVVPQTFTDPRAFAKAVRSVNPDGPDVVLTHQPSGTWAASRAVPEIPCVNVFHASAYREAKHRRATGLSAVGRLRSRVVEPILGWLEPRNLRYARSILVLSEFSKSLIATDHPSVLPKVVVAGGGVDVHHFQPHHDRAALRSFLGVGEDQELLVTVRRIVARTGVDMLLDAFSTIAAARPAADLVIVGDGELRPAMERRSRELGLDKRVRFLGRVSDADVLAWYQAADLFLLPTVAYEGFGMSTAEALACGTPAIGTPVGATREVLSPIDARWVSDSETAADFAEAAERELANGIAARRQEARDHALASLSIAAMAERWETAIATALESEPVSN